MLGFWVFMAVMEVMREREREIRERHKYILLCKYIILMYCIRNKSWDVGSIVKWYGIIDKVIFWDGKIG